MKIPNLEQYVAIFPKGAGTGHVPKRDRKIPFIITSTRIIVAFYKNVFLFVGSEIKIQWDIEFNTK